MINDNLCYYNIILHYPTLYNNEANLSIYIGLWKEDDPKAIGIEDIGYTQNDNLYNRYDCLETKCYQMISLGNSLLSVIPELLIQPLDTAFGEIKDEIHRPFLAII